MKLLSAIELILILNTLYIDCEPLLWILGRFKNIKSRIIKRATWQIFRIQQKGSCINQRIRDYNKRQHRQSEDANRLIRIYIRNDSDCSHLEKPQACGRSKNVISSEYRLVSHSKVLRMITTVQHLVSPALPHAVSYLDSSELSTIPVSIFWTVQDDCTVRYWACLNLIHFIQQILF